MPNNLPTQPTEMNLPTNQQVSVRDALEIVLYFDGSSKVLLTIFIEACKEAKEMVPNAEANLVKLLRTLANWLNGSFTLYRKAIVKL